MERGYNYDVCVCVGRNDGEIGIGRTRETLKKHILRIEDFYHDPVLNHRTRGILIVKALYVYF